MPRRVYEVERIELSIRRCVPHPGLVELDGDSPLPLEIHAIKELSL